MTQKRTRITSPARPAQVTVYGNSDSGGKYGPGIRTFGFGARASTRTLTATSTRTSPRASTRTRRIATRELIALSHCRIAMLHALRCNTLQHAATRCSTLQHAATRPSLHCRHAMPFVDCNGTRAKGERDRAVEQRGACKALSIRVTCCSRLSLSLSASAYSVFKT